MSNVRLLTISPDDAELRLDRWFGRNFPNISHGNLQKLLRTGQIRIDGRRAKSNYRLNAGETIRVPPLGDMDRPKKSQWREEKNYKSDGSLEELLRKSILHMDDEVLAIYKPPGVPVQGGTGTSKHIDGALDALRFESDQRPRLVHRLDKDTSGVLLLGRTRQAAKWLTQAFREQTADKTYWGVVVGELRPSTGRIDLPIAKLPGPHGEKMVIDRKEGQRAVTDYGIIEKLGNRASWVAMRPRTGRTHQLRVHMMALGVPILGDGKYGGEGAFLESHGLSRKLHLHAQDICLPRPNGNTLFVEAKLPEHMAKSWNLLGFDSKSYIDPFLDKLKTKK
jgi:23S rRNA pseudouridine955/2504/2580 synthase